MKYSIAKFFLLFFFSILSTFNNKKKKQLPQVNKGLCVGFVNAKLEREIS